MKELEKEYQNICMKIEEGASLVELLQSNQALFTLLQKSFNASSQEEKERAADIYQQYMQKILSLAKRAGEGSTPEAEALVAGALGALRKSRLDPGSFPR